MHPGSGPSAGVTNLRTYVIGTTADRGSAPLSIPTPTVGFPAAFPHFFNMASYHHHQVGCLGNQPSAFFGGGDQQQHQQRRCFHPKEPQSFRQNELQPNLAGSNVDGDPASHGQDVPPGNPTRTATPNFRESFVANVVVPAASNENGPSLFELKSGKKAEEGKNSTTGGEDEPVKVATRAGEVIQHQESTEATMEQSGCLQQKQREQRLVEREGLQFKEHEAEPRPEQPLQRQLNEPRTAPPAEIKCPTCSKPFGSRPKLALHIKEVHLRERGARFDGEGRPVRNVVKCPTCRMYFENRQKLAIHIRESHLVERLSRIQSNKDFAKLPRLSTSRSSSSMNAKYLRAKPRVKQEASFPCDRCGKMFRRTDHLSRHVRETHNNVKKYHCEHEGCQHQTSDRHRMVEHLEAMHLKIKKHICDKCGHATSWPQCLAKHMFLIHGIGEGRESWKRDKMDKELLTAEVASSPSSLPKTPAQSSAAPAAGTLVPSATSVSPAAPLNSALVLEAPASEGSSQEVVGSDPSTRHQLHADGQVLANHHHHQLYHQHPLMIPYNHILPAHHIHDTPSGKINDNLLNHPNNAVVVYAGYPSYHQHSQQTCANVPTIDSLNNSLHAKESSWPLSSTERFPLAGGFHFPGSFQFPPGSFQFQGRGNQAS